jgi:hypothetical protein
MSVNRISQHQRQESASDLYAAPAPTTTLQGFVAYACFVMPVSAIPQWGWHQEILRAAYEAAQSSRAIASDYDHRFFSNWN